MKTFRDDLSSMLQNPAFQKRYKEEKKRLFLGYQIRQARKKRKISQKDLAKLTGLTSRQISQIETAEEPQYDLATLLQVSAPLGLTLALVPQTQIAYPRRKVYSTMAMAS